MSLKNLSLTAVGASLACAGVMSAHAQAVPGGSLDPLLIPKYATPLVIPPVLYDDGGNVLNGMSVEVALRQFSQQVLPITGCTKASQANVGAGLPPIPCVGDAFPATALWGYGDPSRPGTFNNPAFTLEVTTNTPTTVKWTNDLVRDPDKCRNLPAKRKRTNRACQYLPHIVTDSRGRPLIDQTLHWANPPQQCIDGARRSDCRGYNPFPYRGPVPMVTHVHGAHVEPVSDGYPEAWWLPDANNIPGSYATEGTFYSDTTYTDDIPGNETPPGSGYAVYTYSNDQPSTTLWYHDHSLGITRLNVYAAAAGFWLIRTANDGEDGLDFGTLPGPAPRADEDPNGDPTVRAAIREIPVAIQDKAFNLNGSQFYPANRAFFEGLGDGQTYDRNRREGLRIPFLPIPLSDISPIWNPEAFFNTMVVNGNTWPKLDVAQAQYRLRLLNANDSRFLNLALFVVNADGSLGQEIPVYQIGSEQSLLPNVVQVSTGFKTELPGNGTIPSATPAADPQEALLMGPAERADVIVDFSGLPNDTVIRMTNTGPDAPFGGFPDPAEADPATTGQVMQFVVNTALNGVSPTDPGKAKPATAPEDLVLSDDPGGVPKFDPDIDTPIRDLALLEEESALVCFNVDPVTGVIRWVPLSRPPACARGGVPFAPKAAVLGINGSSGLGTVTLWDDPIVTDPTLGDIETWELWNNSADAHPIHLHLVKFEVVNRQIIGGDLQPSVPTEAGWKDTVIAYPGEVTRVKAKFDIAGLYVWHCHILSHEDNEMMVPYCVVDPADPAGSCPAELF